MSLLVFLLLKTHLNADLMFAGVGVTTQMLTERSPTYTRLVWSVRYLVFKQPELIYMQYLSEIVLLQDDSGSHIKKTLLLRLQAAE